MPPKKVRTAGPSRKQLLAAYKAVTGKSGSALKTPQLLAALQQYHGAGQTGGSLSDWINRISGWIGKAKSVASYAKTHRIPSRVAGVVHDIFPTPMTQNVRDALRHDGWGVRQGGRGVMGTTNNVTRRYVV